LALLWRPLLWRPLPVRRMLGPVALPGAGLVQPVRILVRAGRVLVRIDRCLWPAPGVRVLLLANRRLTQWWLTDWALAHRGLAGRALRRRRLHWLLCGVLCALLAARGRRGSGCAKLPQQRVGREGRALWQSLWGPLRERRRLLALGSAVPRRGPLRRLLGLVLVLSQR
jgi:hypothetical protein